MITVPLTFGRMIGRTAVIQRLVKFMQNFYFIYRMLYNMFYYLRLTGMKLKFLWDTLDHYLLIRRIGRTFWREKLISGTIIAYLSYFLYFRETYFMNPAKDYIWIQDITNRYDRKIRDTAKAAVKNDVFGNEALPEKLAPQLVTLVQQPKIKILMTDLFIILLKNKAFVADATKLVDKLIHDYLNSLDCNQKFSNLIIEQVLRNRETILPGVFKLLHDYLMNESNMPMLEREGSNVLMTVIQINGVVNTVVD